jgi:hypothetical protein
MKIAKIADNSRSWYGLWLAEWTTTDLKGVIKASEGVAPNHHVEIPTVCLQRIPHKLLIAVVPSTKVQVGVRGPQDGGAVVFSFDCDDVIMEIKPLNAQSCCCALMRDMNVNNLVDVINILIPLK